MKHGPRLVVGRCYVAYIGGDMCLVKITGIQENKSWGDCIYLNIETGEKAESGILRKQLGYPIERKETIELLRLWFEKFKANILG